MDGNGSRKQQEDSNDLFSNQSAHLALDIGGTLIKMVYFSSNDNCSDDSQVKLSLEESNEVSDGLRKCLPGNGRLHFVKFETTRINDCLDFISSNQLCITGDLPDEKQHSAGDRNLIKVTSSSEHDQIMIFKQFPHI